MKTINFISSFKVVFFLIVIFSSAKSFALTFSSNCNTSDKIATIEDTTEIIKCITNNLNKPGFNPRKVLQLMAGLPKETPLDFNALKKALPSSLDSYAASTYIQIIRKRQEKEGIPIILKYLPQDMKQEIPRMGALDALLDFDLPVWKQTRIFVDKLYKNGEITEPRYKYAIHRLDEQIKNPEAAYVKKRRGIANQSLQKELDKLYNVQRELGRLKNSDPGKYVARYKQYLAKLYQLAQKYSDAPHVVGLKSRIRVGYDNLENFRRARLKNSAKENRGTIIDNSISQRGQYYRLLKYNEYKKALYLLFTMVDKNDTWAKEEYYVWMNEILNKDYTHYPLSPEITRKAQIIIMDRVNMAAESGEAQAQYDLAMIILQGPNPDADENLTEAVSLLTKAADQGNWSAKFILSQMNKKAVESRGITSKYLIDKNE